MNVTFAGSHESTAVMQATGTGVGAGEGAGGGVLPPPAAHASTVVAPAVVTWTAETMVNDNVSTSAMSAARDRADLIIRTPSARAAIPIASKSARGAPV